MLVDVLYVAWNRRAFTELSYRLLAENTDWSLVNRLVIYDDGSTDGTLEWLLEQPPPIANTVFLTDKVRSPPAVMNLYLRQFRADWVAKIDNDIAVPPGWLPAMLAVLDANPAVDLLGMEAGRTGYPGQDGAPFDGHTFTEASHIGGVGLMRTSVFRSRPIPTHGRFGFDHWQRKWEPVRGWITPDLLCPQLDRIPVEPYLSLSDLYIRSGWQREWPKMDPRYPAYYEWLTGVAV